MRGRLERLVGCARRKLTAVLRSAAEERRQARSNVRADVYREEISACATVLPAFNYCSCSRRTINRRRVHFSVASTVQRPSFVAKTSLFACADQKADVVSDQKANIATDHKANIRVRRLRRFARTSFLCS